MLRGNRPSPGTLVGMLRLPLPHFPASDPRAALAISPPDPRIHAALVCGARSCPPIAVYSSVALDAALDAAMAAFCEGGVVVDEAGRTVTLSSIFKARKGNGRVGWLNWGVGRGPAFARAGRRRTALAPTRTP